MVHGKETILYALRDDRALESHIAGDGGYSLIQRERGELVMEPMFVDGNQNRGWLKETTIRFPGESYDLPAGYHLHLCGPTWSNNDQPSYLRLRISADYNDLNLSKNMYFVEYPSGDSHVVGILPFQQAFQALQQGYSLGGKDRGLVEYIAPRFVELYRNRKGIQLFGPRNPNFASGYRDLENPSRIWTAIVRNIDKPNRHYRLLPHEDNPRRVKNFISHRMSDFDGLHAAAAPVAREMADLTQNLPTLEREFNARQISHFDSTNRGWASVIVSSVTRAAVSELVGDGISSLLGE